MIVPKVSCKLVAPHRSRSLGMLSIVEPDKPSVTIAVGSQQHTSSKPKFILRVPNANKKIEVIVTRSTNRKAKLAATERPMQAEDTAQAIAKERGRSSPSLRNHVAGATMAHIRRPNASA